MRLARSAVGVAGAALLLAWGGCAEQPAHRSGRIGEDEPTRLVVDLVLRESEAGRMRWVLRADSALSFAESEPTLLRGMTLDFYDPAGDSVLSILTAREGEVAEGRRDLVARGGVVVRTAEGHRLETEELRYDHEAGQVVSRVFVRLTRGGSVLTGVGIESDPQLRAYRILSEVEAGVREGERILDGF